MTCSGNVLEMKMKEKNIRNPSFDGRIGLKVRVIDHTLHILCIHLNCKTCDTKNKNANCSQSTGQPIQLKLYLQVAALDFHETNGTEVIWISLFIIPDLQQNKPNCDIRSINSKDDLVSGHVIQLTKHRRMTDHILKTLYY